MLQPGKGKLGLLVESGGIIRRTVLSSSESPATRTGVLLQLRGFLGIERHGDARSREPKGRRVYLPQFHFCSSKGCSGERLSTPDYSSMLKRVHGMTFSMKEVERDSSITCHLCFCVVIRWRMRFLHWVQGSLCSNPAALIRNGR